MLSHLFQRTSKALPSWLSTAWEFSQRRSCLCIFGAVRLSSIFLQLRFVWWIYLQNFVFLQHLKIGSWTLRKSHQQPAGGFQWAGRKWDQKGFRGLCQGTVLPQGRSLSEVWNILPAMILLRMKPVFFLLTSSWPPCKPWKPRLIEWIEVLRALGADHIFSYLLEVHPNVTKVCRFSKSMNHRSFAGWI